LTGRLLDCSAEQDEGPGLPDPDVIVAPEELVHVSLDARPKVRIVVEGDVAARHRPALIVLEIARHARVVV
jgi:hypothetical protein